MYRIGIDVGGTFTDLVVVNYFGSATLAKVLSTPADPSIGVLDGLKLLADTLGLELGPCCRKPSASCTARPSRPTHSSNIRALGSDC